MVTKVNYVKNSHGGMVTLPPPYGRPCNGYIMYSKLMLRNSRLSDNSVFFLFVFFYENLKRLHRLYSVDLKPYKICNHYQPTTTSRHL